MEKATRNKSSKTKTYKTNEAVTKAKKIYAKKLSRASKNKRVYDFGKIRNKNSKYSVDDSQSKETFSPSVNKWFYNVLNVSLTNFSFLHPTHSSSNLSENFK